MHITWGCTVYSCAYGCLVPHFTKYTHLSNTQRSYKVIYKMSPIIVDCIFSLSNHLHTPTLVPPTHSMIL